MSTISLCMIVKNEEEVLERCLSSVADLMDEIIIVDTGSTDGTKQIAAKYTDRIFDFAWIDDFSAARNFAFSKASCDYIYSADADEMLDEKNRRQFRFLKEALLPEVEIVQMHYLTPAEYNNTQNYSHEYRPKLYKRLRTWTWIDPVHETVRLDPVVFNSDVEILHMPMGLHAARDFGIFEKSFKEQGHLSPKLYSMYAKELYKNGTLKDLANAKEAFTLALNDPSAKELGIYEDAVCILSRLARLEGRTDDFFALAFRLMPDHMTSELVCEIGAFYQEKGAYEEAISWYQMTEHEVSPIIDVRTSGPVPYTALKECLLAQAEATKDAEEEKLFRDTAGYYEHLAKAWKMPE